MSSTISILRASTTIVKKQILPNVPKRWSHQVAFGTNALSLRPLTSCNANARTAAAVRSTAESKMFRLLANTSLPSALAGAVNDLRLVTAHSYVNVDHSDFNGLVALVFAVQTRIGRALPIFQQTAYSGKLSARDDVPKRTKELRAKYEAQNRAANKKTKNNETKRTIASLKALRKLLGVWPKLVFDRGFGSREIIRLLVREEATFYIRLKSSRLVEIAGQGNGKPFPIQNSKRADERVVVAGRELRVVRSPKTGKDDEPWYILTNDLEYSRNKVVKIYYHRFEIEETFRDTKTILGLRRTKLKNPNSLCVLLWFVILGILLLYLAGLECMGIRALRARLSQPHPKKRLSWYRILMEMREMEITQLCQAAMAGVA